MQNKVSVVVQWILSVSYWINCLLTLTSKLLKQGYVLPRLITTFRKLYGRHHDLIGKYNMSCSDMAKDLFASNANSTDGPSVS